MLQMYADNALVYDSRLEELALLSLPVHTGVAIGGTASPVFPAGHPYLSRFTSYKTIVTIYKDNLLVFRGRALYPEDDFQNNRTIVCEGERCFLNDALLRPYVYQDSPAAIFTDVVNLYNTGVEESKQFEVGTITVTDPNDYIRLESEDAESALSVLEKLVDRCGGYLVFTTNATGKRCINWLEKLDYKTGQTIEFGENLLDFSRSGANTALATAILPYGARDAETGIRVGIESVNGGVDFIQDPEAVALRGMIMVPVIYDDITEPANLLKKAEKDLAARKLMVTSLQLTAFDLSNRDKSIDSFREGDLVRVTSRPHGVDEDFLLMEKEEDLLRPDSGKITLGQEKKSLTGMESLTSKQQANRLQQVEHNVRAEYTLNLAAAIEEAKQTLTSLIQQTSDSIKLEVSEVYATNGDVESAISTSLTQLNDSFTFLFSQLQTTVNENDADAREQFATIQKYIRFDDGNIVLGKVGNEITLHIENDRISFLESGAEVAYFSNRQLIVTDAHFLNSLRIGAFQFLPRENGNLSLVKVGD